MKGRSLVTKLFRKLSKTKSNSMNSKEDIVQSQTSSEWRILYFLMATICMPIALPFVVMNIIKRNTEAKYRNCLPGKVVLITGASSGLGEALAHTFYRAGCKVVLAARRENELERVRKDLLNSQSNGVTHPPVIVPLDLSDLNNMPSVVQKILNTHSHIDILINNGGISVRADVMSTAMDVDIKVMLVNYFGAVALTKAVLPSMTKRKEGHIVFISSVQGKFALPYRSAYSASKHALQAFSDSLRSEVSQKGIKVTCISPGYIQTQLSINALTSTGKSYGKMDASTLTGSSPEKMAKSVLSAILREEKDVILSQVTGVIAYYIRILFPSLYFWIMERRARKLEA